MPDARGDRTGFKGQRYKTQLLAESSYRDIFDDYLEFLGPRLVEARRLLKQNGTLYFHIDYREAHYCKVLLDEILAARLPQRDHLGLRLRRAREGSWPASTTPSSSTRRTRAYHFDRTRSIAIPYMAPGLVGAGEGGAGQAPDRVWWHTIVPTTARKARLPDAEARGHRPPHGLASTEPVTGASTSSPERDARSCCRTGGRHYVVVDVNPEACRVMRKRLGVTDSLEPAAPQADLSDEAELRLASLF